jgi:hypothetical protein
LDPFVIGQLFAQLPDWDDKDEVDFSDALDSLVEAERDTVVEALQNGFGGVSGLYASLWQSAPESGLDHVAEDEKADNNERFEADDVGKFKAFEWVSDGCPRRCES